jgi:5-methylcytosine-specific restriction endonuclease McrA
VLSQAGRCALCGHRHVLTIHHVVALEDEGTNDRSNLMGLCRPCHLMWHGSGKGCGDAEWSPLEDLVHVYHGPNFPTKS